MVTISLSKSPWAQLQLYYHAFWLFSCLLPRTTTTAGCPPPPSPLDSQSMAALLELRSQLRIGNEIWPELGDPCTSWPGIACTISDDDHTRLVVVVSSVDLSNLPLQQSQWQPPNSNASMALAPLQRLPFLQSINASGFAVSAPLPQWLTSLHWLELLDFASSDVQGEIPPSIATLSRLRLFRLARNNLTGKIPPPLFRHLTNLSVVDLSQNALTGRIPDVSALRRLRSLDCSSNRLRGAIPATIASLPDLQLLNLSTNRLAVAPPPQLLYSLPRLTTLDLSFNRLTGMLAPPPANATLPTGLRHLSLSHNLLYGPLPHLPIPAADFSYNFFDAAAHAVTKAANVEFNCVDGAANQRSMASCTAFYSKRGLAFQGTAADVSSVVIGQATARPKMTDSAAPGAAGTYRRRKTLLDSVAVGLVSAMAAIVGAVCLLLFVAHRRDCLLVCISRKRSWRRKEVEQEGQLSELLRFVARELSLEELKKATGGFGQSSCLQWQGRDRSEVYYCGLLDGVEVVVKKVGIRQRQSMRRLQREMSILLKHPHRRLVPLLGYCIDHQHHSFLLVYKHMAKGDLRRLLFGGCGADSPLLDWPSRLKIATGVAEGLLHLHHGCSPPLVHSNIRASSILVDERFEARLGNLGGAITVDEEVAAPVAGLRLSARLLRLDNSHGHAADHAGRPSRSYDVYCFGKLLLQLITGASVDDFEPPCSCLISEYSLKKKTGGHNNCKLLQLDPSLGLVLEGEDVAAAKEVRGVATVAKWCLHPEPSKRPSMPQVVKALQNPIKVVGLKQHHGAAGAVHHRQPSNNSSWSDLVLGGLWHHSFGVGSDSESTHRDEAPPPVVVVHVRKRFGSSEVFPEP